MRPVTLEVVETPLDKVVEQLARQLDVDILMDQKALNDVGIDPTTPVTIQSDEDFLSALPWTGFCVSSN